MTRHLSSIARLICRGAGMAVALLLASCALPQTGPLPAAAQAERLARLARQHHVCAVAVAVLQQRELQSVSTASGCEPALPVRPDSVFQAASLSKPVFAYAVLKLVQQGLLALDVPVLHYLPHGYRHAFNPLRQGPAAQTDEVVDPRLSAVTVRMLLQHTAGLPNWAAGPLRFDDTPGRRWAYSGEGYVLLQRALEAVMGQPLDAVMQDQVFTPLGMANSSYRWLPRLDEALLPGTKANGAPRAMMRLDPPVAAFSLYTTVEDYAHFVAALLHDQALLDMIVSAPVEVDPQLNLRWGLGWGLEEGTDGVHLWQWGNNPGYRAFVIARPATGDGLVMLTNGEGGLKLAGPLVRAAMPDAAHQVFRSSYLGGGIVDTLCDWFRLCL